MHIPLWKYNFIKLTNYYSTHLTPVALGAHTFSLFEVLRRWDEDENFCCLLSTTLISHFYRSCIGGEKLWSCKRTSNWQRASTWMRNHWESSNNGEHKKFHIFLENIIETLGFAKIKNKTFLLIVLITGK